MYLCCTISIGTISTYNKHRYNVVHNKKRTLTFKRSFIYRFESEQEKFFTFPKRLFSIYFWELIILSYTFYINNTGHLWHRHHSSSPLWHIHKWSTSTLYINYCIHLHTKAKYESSTSSFTTKHYIYHIFANMEV